MSDQFLFFGFRAQQAGDSLPGSRFAMEINAELRKRISKFAGVHEDTPNSRGPRQCQAGPAGSHVSFLDVALRCGAVVARLVRAFLEQPPCTTGRWPRAILGVRYSDRARCVLAVRQELTLVACYRCCARLGGVASGSSRRCRGLSAGSSGFSQPNLVDSRPHLAS